MPVSVKICGVSDAAMAQIALEAGASHIGLVFFPRSPRFVTVEQAAEILSPLPLGEADARRASGEGSRDSPHPNLLPEGEGIISVGLFVDPSDAQLEETLKTVPLDMLQLHGRETTQRVAEIKNRFGLPVMKAVSIGSAADLDQVVAYEDVCDWLLFDARPPKESVLPGGNGLVFDWQLLKGRTWQRPWMLSGGLTPKNVGQAIGITGATAVDVSSGVETSPGVKNGKLVRQFIAATLRP